MLPNARPFKLNDWVLNTVEAIGNRYDRKFTSDELATHETVF